MNFKLYKNLKFKFQFLKKRRGAFKLRACSNLGRLLINEKRVRISTLEIVKAHAL